MLKILGLEFHIYGFLIGLGILLAIETSLWAARKLKMERELLEGAWLWAIVPGILGARIYHVIDLWDEIYRQDLIKTLYFWEGGLGIWGAVVGGIIGLGIYYRFKIYDSHQVGGQVRDKISFLKLLDVAVIGLPLTQAIGRWGNFANQELYGKPTNLPWGMKVHEFAGRVHPLFLYESLLDLALFFTLILVVKRTKRYEPGRILGGYLIGYGTIRFLLEWWRPDQVVWKWLGVPVAVIFSLAAIGLGSYLIRTSSRAS